MNIFLIVQAVLDPLWKACELLCEFSESPNKSQFEKIRNMDIGKDIRYVYERGCYDWFLTFQAAKELYDFAKNQADIPGSPKYSVLASWLEPVCRVLMEKEHPVHKIGKVCIGTTRAVSHDDILCGIREEYSLPEDWDFSGPLNYRHAYDRKSGITTVIISETSYIQGYQEIISDQKYYVVKTYARPFHADKEEVVLLPVENYTCNLDNDPFVQFDHISRTVKY